VNESICSSFSRRLATGRRTDRRGPVDGLQRRGLEKAEAQRAGDAVALLAPWAISRGGRDGGVEPAFASLAVKHWDGPLFGGESRPGGEVSLVPVLRTVQTFLRSDDETRPRWRDGGIPAS
jgi:hypothetical protein